MSLVLVTYHYAITVDVALCPLLLFWGQGVEYGVWLPVGVFLSTTISDNMKRVCAAALSLPRIYPFYVCIPVASYLPSPVCAGV